MKFNRVLLLISVLSSILLSQSQWTFQNPNPTGADLKDVSFFDRQNGWAVGVLGTVLHTTDEGATWQLQNAGTMQYLYGAAALSAKKCFIVGAAGTLLKTTNSGATWENVPTGRTGGFMAVKFLTPQIGFVLEGVNYGGTKVLKTTDGGDSWNVYSTGSTEQLNAIAFADTLNGFIVGGGLFGASTILRTTNGGESWNLQVNPTSYSLYSVYAIDTVAWAVGYDGVILRSKVKFTAWEPIVPGNINTKDLNAVAFIDKSIGFAGGMKGEARRTTDGGTTWTTIMSDFLNWKTIRAVDFVDLQYGYLIGERGKIMKTTDGGASWKHLDNALKPELLNLAFSNKDTATCVGYEYTSVNFADGKIYQTTNGGTSWTLRQTSVNYPMYTVTFPTPSVGYASGQYGTIYKTEDYGTTWHSKNISFLGKILGLYFLSPTYGVAVGDSGAAFVTGDGGTNWLRKNTGTLTTLNYLTFKRMPPPDTSLVGFAVGNNGVVLRTSNDGQTWTAVPSFTTASLYGVHFIDKKAGWVAGSASTVYKTTDGGANWVKQTLPASTTLQSIFFSNERKGFAVGWYGGIYGTTNGGDQWFKQTVTPNSLYNVSFVDTATGWILGDGGTILKTATGTVTSIRGSDAGQAIPSTYVLEQNYPNPFNPATTIRFGIPEASNVTVVVYDILGRTVAQLFNDRMEAGYQQVVWNARTASGIYLYRIDCRSVSDPNRRFSQVRKMLFMK
ncbi:MAG: YCF48-related protein [Bacteroidota bacterium]